MTDTLGRELGLILRRAQAERLPSVAAALSRGGEIVWSDAVGLANAETGESATPDHQYRIASITKTFTAVAVLQLRDAGALDLDDRLTEHIPVAGKAPTLRRMLAHLSGVQREIPGNVWETLSFPTGDELIARLADAEQVLAPGREWHYSNLAYGLLGGVVERVSGVSFEDYVRERILAPLHLSRTGFDPVAPVAVGYTVDPYSDVLHAEPAIVERGAGAAAGQLWTTPVDLARWGAFLADPDASVLAPATADEMCELQAMAEPDRWTLGWGLGLMLAREHDRVYVGHSGAHLGFLAGLLALRKERLAAAVLTNGSTQAEPVELAAALIEKALELEPDGPEEWRAGDRPPPDVADILGRWWTEGDEFILAWRKGRLEARMAADPPDKQPATFEQESADRWRVASGRERGELLEVVRDEDGQPVKLFWATYPCTRRFTTFGLQPER